MSTRGGQVVKIGLNLVYLVLGSNHIMQQLLFSLFSSILTFHFDLILGSFQTFGALIGYFQGWGRFQKLFGGLLIYTNNFCFLTFALYLLYHVVLSSWWWWVVGVLSDYFVSTQLQLWLFSCWGCGCCWAVTIII